MNNRVRTFLLPKPAVLLEPARVLSGIALTLFLLFLAAHFLGWRENTSILSGTMPAGNGSPLAGGLQGVTYALLWFSTIILVPILALAVALQKILERILLNHSSVRENNVPGDG